MAFMAASHPHCWPTICRRQLPVGSAGQRHVHASGGACKGHCIVQNRCQEPALKEEQQQQQGVCRTVQISGLRQAMHGARFAALMPRSHLRLVARAGCAAGPAPAVCAVSWRGAAACRGLLGASWMRGAGMPRSSGPGLGQTSSAESCWRAAARRALAPQLSATDSLAV